MFCHLGVPCWGDTPWINGYLSRITVKWYNFLFVGDLLENTVCYKAYYYNSLPLCLITNWNVESAWYSESILDKFVVKINLDGGDVLPPFILVVFCSFLPAKFDMFFFPATFYGCFQAHHFFKSRLRAMEVQGILNEASFATSLAVKTLAI